MLTEADMREDDESTPGKKKSKRERRRDAARRRGEWQCEGCRHARMDHTPMQHTHDTFCHACTDVCAAK